jgi:hypothetical protein
VLLQQQRALPRPSTLTRNGDSHDAAPDHGYLEVLSSEWLALVPILAHGEKRRLKDKVTFVPGTPNRLLLLCHATR